MEILLINSCVRKKSRTIKLARQLAKKLGGNVTEVFLEKERIKPLYGLPLVDRTILLEAGELWDDTFSYARQFADADVIILAEIYAAREKNIYKMSSKKLMDEIKIKHPDKDVYFLPEFESMAEFVCNNTSPGDIVITMGAGDIYKVGELILEKAAK